MAFLFEYKQSFLSLKLKRLDRQSLQRLPKRKKY